MRTFKYGIGETGNGRRVLTVALTLSMVCHLSLFAFLVYGPGSRRDRSFFPSVIDVRIVALPPSRSTASQEDGKGREERTQIVRPKATPKGARAAPKAPSVAPRKYKRKASLKKKTFKSSTVVKHALSEIERQVEQSRAGPVAKAIDNLKRAVVDTEKTADNGSGTQGKRALELMDIYKAEIPYHIQNNWVFSEQLAGGRTDLVAWLVIEIRPNGTIRDIWFEKRSGDRYFDEQAHKAVVKSDPLPPLPKGYSRSSFNVGLRFTPSGLK